MAPRELYLHETIDIVGEGAVPYMEESVIAFDAETISDRGLRPFGTWYVQGSTGRWPQVVNIWELVDGWEGWRRLTGRLSDLVDRPPRPTRHCLSCGDEARPQTRC